MRGVRRPECVARNENRSYGKSSIILATHARTVAVRPPVFGIHVLYRVTAACKTCWNRFVRNRVLGYDDGFPNPCASVGAATMREDLLCMWQSLDVHRSRSAPVSEMPRMRSKLALPQLAMLAMLQHARHTDDHTRRLAAA